MFLHHHQMMLAKMNSVLHFECFQVLKMSEVLNYGRGKVLRQIGWKVCFVFVCLFVFLTFSNSAVYGANVCKQF